MRKLYFVVEKSISSDGETLDGNKTITVYEIYDNVLKLFTDIDAELSDKSTDKIQYYLNDNGWDDENFELIQL